MSKKRKILFVAIASSSHTHSWIKLFEEYEDLDISFFGVNGSFSKEFRRYHFKGERLIYGIYELFFKMIQFFNISEKRKKQIEYYIFRLLYLLNYRRLKRKIKRIKPDVVHTLGFEPSGFLILDLFENKYSNKSFKWIHTIRGNELSVKSYLPIDPVKKLLNNCDYLIADNQLHYEIAIELGLNKEKITDVGVIPGTGGMNISILEELNLQKNSNRERIIIWPKAYECPFSKALPVFEALKLCWDDIKPCKIIMTAATKETIMWFNNLPIEIQKSTQIMGRLDRMEYLELLKSSKVMLAPSLSDGIPNCLYEAMAYEVFPILSPITTIKDFCELHGVNVIYADNLYPEKIAKALTEALSYIENRDEKMRINQLLVKKLADRDKVKAKLYVVYQTI